MNRHHCRGYLSTDSYLTKQRIEFNKIRKTQYPLGPRLTPLGFSFVCFTLGCIAGAIIGFINW
jgi:hypothetical protein